MKNISTLFLRTSMENKIAMIIMVTCAFMLFCAFGLFAYYSSYNMKSDKVDSLKVLHKLVSDASYNSLVYRDYDKAVGQLESLRWDKSVDFACIYDFDGAEFVSYSGQGANLKCLPATDLKYGENFLDNHVYIYADIFLDKDRLGSLYIRSNLDDINAGFNELMRYSFIACAGALIISYLICVWLLRFASIPIKSLVRTARLVSENHNYSVRAKKITDDDFGLLVDAFNHMLKQIQERDMAIIEAYEGLELRVGERTQQLEMARRASDSANMAKTAFLTNMSHELRTPMHVILSYSGFGKEEVKTADREALEMYFTRINDSGGRLLLLLNNLLDLSKLESGKVIFDMKMGDFRNVVELVITELQNLLDEKSIKLVINKPDFTPDADFDSSKMVQVVYNLVSNAVKFTPENGQITISYDAVKQPSFSDEKQEVDAISVSVGDSGVGIPETELDTVFDKFIQSSKTVTGAGGTGLGLAICREIINEHHGKIWCQNNDDIGAKFTFTLPVKYDDVE